MSRRLYRTRHNNSKELCNQHYCPKTSSLISVSQNPPEIDCKKDIKSSYPNNNSSHKQSGNSLNTKHNNTFFRPKSLKIRMYPLSASKNTHSTNRLLDCLVKRLNQEAYTIRYRIYLRFRATLINKRNISDAQIH